MPTGSTTATVTAAASRLLLHSNLGARTLTRVSTSRPATRYLASLPFAPLPLQIRAMSSTNNASAAPAAPPPKLPTFAKSPVPANPLGPNTYVKTAACLIIGDEVLNGKTKDSNSNYFAKFCFTLGIDLQRIEVIPDDTEQIVEAAQRLSTRHDLVITSGGIGPTPDDITYESIAKAFGAGLAYHDETIRRMAENLKARNVDTSTVTEEMITARKRMALFPDRDAEVIYPTEQLWVPVVRMKGKLCILPGVPRLFEALLDGLEQYIPIDPNRPRPYRLLIHTRLPESNISPFLVKLTEKCKPEGIKVGSYPKWNNGVDVSLIGEDLGRLQELGKEVEREVQGTILEQGKVGETPAAAAAVAPTTGKM